MKHWLTAGDDRDPQVVVFLEVAPRLRQIAEVIHVQRVLRLGTIDGDDEDVVVTRLVVDGQ